MPKNKSTTSPLRSAHVVYDVWLMTGLKDNTRIAECPSLTKAREAITPEHRKEYVYILKWSPATVTTAAATPDDRFGALQGQHHPPKPTPACQYIWGCLCNRAHTSDLRKSVRKVLRG